MGMLCSLGGSKAAVKQRLQSAQSGLVMNADYRDASPLMLGLYRGELPILPLTDRQWQSRNNQFALASLNQIEAEVRAAMQRYGRHRVGVIIGSSTSGIAEAEQAMAQWLKDGSLATGYDYSQQEMGASAQFIAEVLGLQGPVFGISTACSSGAKALASARRLIRAGICDAVIAGGVDTLCRLTVNGFSSLEAVSDELCNPCSVNRKGINVGEGAALFLLSAEATGVELCGVGEGSDAYHISAPDPGGSGAVRCMTCALQDAGVVAGEVGYVNLHGTATALNDKMESLAIEQVFGLEVPCSSTKPFTGHTLGAAGAVEGGICWLLLEDGGQAMLPPHLWDGQADPELAPIKLVAAGSGPDQPLNYVLSNTFAFGGNNISLLLGRVT